MAGCAQATKLTYLAAIRRPPQVMQLGEPTGQEAVCSLAFSKTGTLLLAGHTNGDVAFWEWHRTVWQNVKHVKGTTTPRRAAVNQAFARAVALVYVCTPRSYADPERGPSADAHVTAVVACAWLDGPPVTALTADSRGRVVQYNVSSYLSIMGAVLS